MSKRTVGSMLAVALALGVAGCGGGSEEAGTGDGAAASGGLATDATFTYAIGADPGGLDPATNVSSAASSLFPFAYDTLVVANKDNKIVPSLATEWTIKPKRATFTIRKGVTCSDGSAVTASVIAKNLDYLKDPKVQYPALGTLDYTVRADDAQGTVAIRFGEPVSFLLQSLEFVPIVCGKGLANRELLQRQTSGSGPYVLDQVVPNDHYTLKVRSGYQWGPDGASTAERGIPARVVMKIVPNETTVANLLVGDQLTTAVIRGAEGKRLRAQKLPTISKALGITQMFFNQARGRIAAEPEVRKALTTALDRAAIAKVGAGSAAPALQAPAVDPCPTGGTADAIPSGGTDAAGRLLDAAGWVKGADGKRAKAGKPLKVTMLGLSSVGPAMTAAAELVATTWREIGVDVKSRIMAEGPSIQALTDGSWDVFPLNQVGVTSPAQFVPFVSGAAPPKGSNWGSVANGEYERLVGEAKLTEDQTAACGIWNRAAEALVGAADVVPMVALDTTWFVTPKASFDVSPLGILPTSIRMHEG